MKADLPAGLDINGMGNEQFQQLRMQLSFPMLAAHRDPCRRIIVCFLFNVLSLGQIVKHVMVVIGI